MSPHEVFEYSEEEQPVAAAYKEAEQHLSQPKHHDGIMHIHAYPCIMIDSESTPSDFESHCKSPVQVLGRQVSRETPFLEVKMEPFFGEAGEAGEVYQSVRLEAIPYLR